MCSPTEPTLQEGLVHLWLRLRMNNGKGVGWGKYFKEKYLESRAVTLIWG